MSVTLTVSEDSTYPYVADSQRAMLTAIRENLSLLASLEQAAKAAGASSVTIHPNDPDFAEKHLAPLGIAVRFADDTQTPERLSALATAFEQMARDNGMENIQFFPRGHREYQQQCEQVSNLLSSRTGRG